MCLVFRVDVYVVWCYELMCVLSGSVSDFCQLQVSKEK